jgi:RNA polymerase sigma factor (sigma-70 family)
MSEIALPIAGVPELPGPVRLLSDERLARLASRGGERAFATLYERHHQALYRYCLSIVRNPQDAQDALQSSLVRALAALRASERDLAVRPWLFRIAHNEAVSILRKRRGGDRELDEQEPSPLSVEDSVERRERLSTLVSDLQELPLRQRAALLMRELSGLSIEEIACALSTSPGATKQTLFEARSSLQAFEEGRAMECDLVRRAISDGDGRVLRSRKLRSHLRGCAECGEFRALIAQRSSELRALALPLPAAASTMLLKQVLAHGAAGGHAGGLAAGTAGVSAGHTAAGSLAVKGLAGVAVLAAAGAGAAHLVSTPARHAPSPPAASHVAAPAASGAAAGPPTGVFHPARAASRKAVSPTAADGQSAAPAAHGASEAASGQGLAGASTGANGGKGLARGRGRGGGAAKERRGQRGAGREREAKHPDKRAHERRGGKPDTGGKAAPAAPPRAPRQGAVTPETVTQHVQPGSPAHPPGGGRMGAEAP